MKPDELRADASYTRPAYTVPEQTVRVIEVQPVMVRVEHEDGTTGAIPKRDFLRVWRPA